MILLRASGKVLEDALVCLKENSHQVQVYFPKVKLKAYRIGNGLPYLQPCK